MNKWKLWVLGLLFIAAAVPSRAQVRGDSYRGHGYVYVAPGAFSGGGNSVGAIGLGVGGELMIYKGFAAGVDVGYHAPTSSFSNGIGLASFNGAYHFVSSTHERRFVPFVTAGYTRSFANNSAANLANYGAGFHYWFKERLALRIEGRDHINTSGPVLHAWQVRIGLVFR